MTVDPEDGRKVLVVEDDAELRGILVEALEEEGYRVVAAGDGLEALDLVRRDLPDVVLLDLGLPLLDGQEFADACRTAQRPVRIVVVSGAEVPPAMANMGAVAQVRKPFDMDELLGTVRRVADERSTA